MKPQRIVLAFVAALLTLSISTAVQAQRFGSPRVISNIPYEMIVGETRLAAGEYEIREMGFENPVFQVYNNDKFMVEATAMPVFATAKEVPQESKVILQKIGDNYYLEKIWIQGKLTGFEFPLPKDALSLLRELEAKARTSSSTATLVAVTTNSVETPVPVAQAAPVAEVQRVEPPAPVIQAAPVAEVQAPAETPARTDDRLGDIAQVTPAQQFPPESAAPQNQTPESSNKELPATAANWLQMVLAGISLLAGSAALRFWRTS